MAKHTHKLKRFKYKSGNTVYFCSLPDCNFKSTPALLIGKRSICNRCGEEFILNEYSIRLAKPHCLNCHNPKDKSSPSYIPSETISEEKKKQLLDGSWEIPKESLSERLSKAVNSKKVEMDEEEI